MTNDSGMTVDTSAVETPEVEDPQADRRIVRLRVKAKRFFMGYVLLRR